MDIELKKILELKNLSERIIEREQLNIKLYDKEILRVVNNQLMPFQTLYKYIDTVDKFNDFAKKYKIKDITRQIYGNDEKASYRFKYKKSEYAIVFPLKYVNVEDLKYILDGENYCKCGLYHIHSCCLDLIGYFDNITMALDFMVKGK